jgi:hypothetical protein
MHCIGYFLTVLPVGLLFSGLSIMAWSSLLNIFLGSGFLFSLELYMGLFIFAGFSKYNFMFDLLPLSGRSDCVYLYVQCD